MELFTYIDSLPPFIQGVLGSAFLAFVLYIGQKSITFLTGRIGKDKKTANNFALMAVASESGHLQAECFFTCLYGAFHYFLKALILIVLSLLISPINHVTSMIGYTASVYFLFRALLYVPHYSSLGKDDAERKVKLNALIESYTNK